MEERRRHPRFVHPGGVEIHVPESNRRLWGHLGDLSRGGVYMEAPEPWTVGTEVEIRLEIDDLEVHALGTICTCHPGVGMGIAFSQIAPEQMNDFEKKLEELEIAEHQHATP